jgi:hypothetical protein
MKRLIVFALLLMGACGGCDKAADDAKPAEAVDAPGAVTLSDAVSPATEVTP